MCNKMRINVKKIKKKKKTVKRKLHKWLLQYLLSFPYLVRTVLEPSIFHPNAFKYDICCRLIHFFRLATNTWVIQMFNNIIIANGIYISIFWQFNFRWTIKETNINYVIEFVTGTVIRPCYAATHSIQPKMADQPAA